MNMNRVSSFYPPATGEYVSPFTAPAMPNLRTLGSAPHKPIIADAARIPRAPLSPQKLAKLANALGVSAPLPASGLPSSSALGGGAGGATRTGISRSASLGRSPVPRSASSSPGFGSQATPGTAIAPALTPGSSSSNGTRTSAAAAAGAAARYFIHVIPPAHFPHPRRRDPEAFAAFRRGALVPVHATLQGQLSAIAREYQLPATAGVVLYLVAEYENGGHGHSEGGNGDSAAAVDDTPKLGKGPRISEDVWKWLWMKISEEQPVSRVGLGLTTDGATLPQSGQSLLRKLSSSSKLNTEYGKTFYPLSSSSKSTVTPAEGEAEIETEEGKDAKELSPLDPSTSSQFSTTSSNPSTAETPATSSFEFDTRLLPGLGSTSAIPVLAKVEFDVDRSVGAWYEKWRRSRRALQKRRADKEKGDGGGKVPLRITVNGRKGSVSPLSGTSSDEEDEVEEPGYSKLSESEPDSDDQQQQRTARRGDPLADVFGTDGETWQDAQSARPSRRKKKGDLALSGAELAALPSSSSEVGETPGVGSDKEEVMALWNQQGQPQLDGSALHPEGRKPVPPPLNMAASKGAFLDTTITTASPYASSYDSDSTRLPYLSESDPKRLGGIYDDLELDLADDIDLEAHRAQQLKVGQELDVLERNLAQFSPRALVSVDLTPDLMLPPESPYFRSAPPETTSFSPSAVQPLTSPQLSQTAGGERKRMVPTLQQLLPARPSMMEMEDDFARPPMFRQPKLVGTPSPDTGSFDRGAPGFNTASSSSEGLSQAAWPAVPYSALANRNGDGPLSPKSTTSSLKLKGAASPPRVVLNGNAGGEQQHQQYYPQHPRPFDERRKNPSVSSVFSTGSARSVSESLARSKQYEEDTGYDAEAVALPPSLGRRTEERSGSPGIPLSPDPFGRFPSSTESPLSLPPERTSSLTNERHSHTPSSRFSVDSVKEDQSQSSSSLKPNNSRSTLVSMKSIRKLWRTKNKSSISGASLPPSPDPSTMPSRPPSSALSLQFSEATTMSRTPSPPNLNTPTLSSSSGMPGARGGGVAKQAQKGNGSGSGGGSSSNGNHHKRPDSGLDPFYFDQDPRYPSRRSPSPEASSGSGNGQYQFPKTRTPPPDAALTSAMSSPPTTQPSSFSAGKRTSVRKSLIRRKNGGGSDAGSSQSEGGTTGSGSTGSAGGEPRRRRRPSLLDMAGLMRGSMSMSISSVQSPSVPELPVEFRQNNGQTHSRAQSRSSLSAMAVLNSAAEREREGANGAVVSSSSVSSTSTSTFMTTTITTANMANMATATNVNVDAVRRKPVTQSSTDSSQESTEALLTPVSTVAPLMFGKGRRGSRLGRLDGSGGGYGYGDDGPGEGGEEDGDAASFDESQFEIVSPRVDRFASGVVYAPGGVIVHRDD